MGKTMTHGNDERNCDVFRRQEDIDSMREFCTWLRQGGMQSLRDMQATANEWKNMKANSVSALVKGIVTFILLAVGLGIAAIIKKQP
jgi:hypothetical protein